MLKLILIFILALLIPEIIKTHGIDHPIKTKRGVYAEVVEVNSFFHLPRGQPESGASIIKDSDKIPRNKGEPNLRVFIIQKTQLVTPRNKGKPTKFKLKKKTLRSLFLCTKVYSKQSTVNPLRNPSVSSLFFIVKEVM